MLQKHFLSRISNYKSHRFITSLINSPNHEEIKEYIAKHSNNEQNNITSGIIEKVGRNLHNDPLSPLCITKKKIELYCNEYALLKNKNNKKYHHPKFNLFNNLSPIVRPYECFDELRVPSDHVSRSKSDTYYISNNELLRTHTSAHQCSLMASGEIAFLCSGDVYRRDEVDSSHYPVFHQMEGVRLYPNEHWDPSLTLDERKAIVADDLKDLLSGLTRHLFGQNIEMKWSNDYFPFTEPSFELEVLFNDKWLEVLGCGVIHDDVMVNAGINSNNNSNSNSNDNVPRVGYAFGLGLERLAMVLFDIPDIRLFWSKDDRFKDQFKSGDIVKFTPYSKYPMTSRDVSFWLPNSINNEGIQVEIVHDNDIHEIIRNIAGDIVEKVELFDEFTHPKNHKKSQAYRITYRHMDRSLTNEEVDEIQTEVRQTLEKELGVQLR